MADDVKIRPSIATSAVSVATDEVSARHFQVVKLAHGVDGVATLSSDQNPHPVDVPRRHRDGFARLRMSAPETLFDSSLVHGKVPVIWDESIGGSASSSHVAGDATVRMGVTTAGDSVIRQTRMRFLYQPGKSMQCLFTGLMSSEASVTKRLGMYDGTDGLYFETDGVALNVVVTDGGVPTKVPQSSWDDPMDGTGPSGLTLDTTKVQIWAIDWQWLGVGSVRFGFFIGGDFVPVHIVHHANVSTTTYMGTANLPVRYEVSSDGGAGTLDQICCAVMSEGGSQRFGVVRSVDTGPTAISLSSATTEYAMIGIRLKAAALDALVEDIEASIITLSTGDNFRWRLHLNPTLSAPPSYSSADASSPVEWANISGAQTVTAPGTVLGGGFVPADTSALERAVKNALRLGAAIDGTPDEIVLTITPMNGAGSFAAEMSWREVP